MSSQPCQTRGRTLTQGWAGVGGRQFVGIEGTLVISPSLSWTLWPQRALPSPRCPTAAQARDRSWAPQGCSLRARAAGCSEAVSQLPAVTFIFWGVGLGWLLQHLKTPPRFERLPHLLSFSGRQCPPPSPEVSKARYSLSQRPLHLGPEHES